MVLAYIRVEMPTAHYPDPSVADPGITASSSLLTRFPLELLFWLAGLLFLRLCDPASGPGIDLCVLHRLGFHYCPGCGLGRSISFFLRGDAARSIDTHPLGPFAIVVIGHRVLSLTRQYFNHRKKGTFHAQPDAVASRD